MQFLLVVRRNLHFVLFTFVLEARILRWQILLGDELAVVFGLRRKLLLVNKLPRRLISLLRQLLLDFLVIRAFVAGLIWISVRVDLLAAHQIILC